MKSIKSVDYFLPKIEALVGNQSLPSGKTNPMIVTGVCTTTGKKDDYVVKYISSNEMDKQASLRELLGAFIGMELGLRVVEPVLMHISPEFAESMKGRPEYGVAYKSLGFNFGSKYLKGNLPFGKNQALTSSQIQAAKEIFAFDVFISNVDRRLEKPNLFKIEDHIHIFDHDLAFSFLFDLFPNQTPWLIRPLDLNWIQNHFFYNKLKSKDVNFDDFSVKLKNIDTDFWVKTEQFIPKDWITDQFYRTKEHLACIVNHNEEFNSELKRILL